MLNKKKPISFKGKSIHVLYTGLVYSEVITGGDQLFLDIAPRLPSDLKIIIITPEFTKKHWKKVEKKNFEYRFLPANHFDNKGNPIFIFISYMIRVWQVYRILKKENIQTIYSSSDIAYADIWPPYMIMKKRVGVKWLSRIYHVILPPKERQGNYIVNAVAYRLQRLSFWMMQKRSTKIFALNKKLYDEVLNLGFTKNKLDILGAGIDFNKISNHVSKKKYSYDIVALGRIAPVKGIFDTVKIWKSVHEKFPDLNLAWIGGGSESFNNKVKDQLKENSLTESFHLLGFIDKDEVYSILQSAKIFICPDHENGWGLAVCEAMSSGLPVASYDLDIFGGVYSKGYVSAPLYDTESFAANIIDLIKDEPKRKQMAKDAASQAKEFDHEQIINKLCENI